MLPSHPGQSGARTTAPLFLAEGRYTVPDHSVLWRVARRAARAGLPRQSPGRWRRASGLLPSLRVHQEGRIDLAAQREFVNSQYPRHARSRAREASADSSDRRNTRGFRELRWLVTAGRVGRHMAAKRERFARLIARGVGSAEACRIVGVHPKTGKRWRLGRAITSSSGARLHYPPVVGARKAGDLAAVLVRG